MHHQEESKTQPLGSIYIRGEYQGMEGVDGQNVSRVS
jgi:hypothetical protein